MTLSSRSPLVSVIIPCRGHARELRQCLAGVTSQGASFRRPFEVVVVDSAEDDAVATSVARFPGVILARSDDLLLPGGARNLGVTRSRGALLVFTDADCHPQPGWLAAAVAAIEDGGIIATGPVSDAWPDHPIAVADNLLQFADFSPRRPAGPTSYFPGCNVTMHRATLEDLGGFPADVPAGEDTLLSDAALARWPQGISYVPGMWVRHRGRMTLAAFWKHQETFGFYRGSLGLRLRPERRRAGRNAFFAAIVAAMKIGYVLRQSLRWQPLAATRTLLLGPLVILGQLAWARGFRRGCREPREPSS